ncbi:MAG: hypothetical protein VB031_04490 [Eubacteriaceae bacterium]|nr:hypothetical protein [Eubacteriaceae bacterium]
MKKIIAISLCCCFCLCSLMIPHDTAFGAEKGKTVKTTATISEYNILMSMSGKSMSSLRSMGFSRTQAKMIKAKAVPKAKCGDVTYTISYTKSKFRYKKGNTYLQTKMTWSWKKLPHFLASDIAAMTTSEHFAMTSGSASINYYKGGKKSSNKKTVKKRAFTKNSGKGAYCKFPMAQLMKYKKKYYYYDALSGSMTVNWRVSGNVKSVGISSNYGHTTVSCVPSVSFGAGGGSISFSPVACVKKGVEAYRNIRR